MSINKAQSDIFDVLRSTTGVTELSFDIYQPKAYRCHPRITVRVPASSSYVPEVSDFQYLREDSPRYVVGLNSVVNQYINSHIFLIDFDSKERAIIDAFFDEYELRGWLLNSGSSFHFIGKEVMSRTRWELLMKELTHHKGLCQDFLKWSIKRGYGTLRFTANDKKPRIPEVIKEI